LMQRSCRK